MRKANLLVAALLVMSFAGGCGNNQSTETTHCAYTVSSQASDLGHGSASNPVRLDNNIKFNFSSSMYFDKKIVDIVDGRKIVKALVNNGENLCIYEIDVTDAPDGWDKLENKNNVYQVNSIERQKVSAMELYNIGLYNGDDLTKVCNTTIVKGQLVHTHTDVCKH